MRQTTLINDAFFRKYKGKIIDIQHNILGWKFRGKVIGYYTANNQSVVIELKRDPKRFINYAGVIVMEPMIRGLDKPLKQDGRYIWFRRDAYKFEVVK